MWIAGPIAELRDWMLTALPKDSLRARFVKGAFWSLGGAVISQGLALAAFIITARLLGKVGFGELGMIRSTVGMFGVFAGFGLGLTATKHVAEFRAKDPERTGRIIGLSAISAAVFGAASALAVYIIAPTLAAKAIKAPHLAMELRIGCGLLFLDALSGAQTGALAGFEAFKTIAKANLARGLLSFPIIVIAVWFWGLPGAVGAMVAVAAVGLLINHLALGIECRRAAVQVRYSRVRSEWPILWKFSLPAFLASAMVGPVTWLTNAMLVNRPDGYAEMGIYHAAIRWRTALLFLPAAMGRVVVPMLSSFFALGNRQAVKKVLRGAMLAAGAASVPFALALILFSSHVMALYGKSFAQGAVVLSIVAITIALLAVQQPVGQVIVASGRMWVGAAMNLCWAIVLLCICWLLLSRGWGARGVAIANLSAYGAHSIWVFLFARYLLAGRSSQRPARRASNVSRPEEMLPNPQPSNDSPSGSKGRFKP